jgi:hypothetical protein
VSTYRIVRMFKSSDHPTQVVKRGLTLREAREHCRDPETSSSTCTTKLGQERTEKFGAWFDGYEEDPASHRLGS